MGKISEIDAASLALLYNYQATNGMGLLLSYDKIKKYIELVNNNLDEMGSNINWLFNSSDLEQIYFYSCDEDGKAYLILKPDFNIKKARSDYMGCRPTEILVATQKANALDAIGLELIDGQIRKKESEKSKVKSLVPKTQII